MTQLETSRLILRPWCDSDAQALYRWARDLFQIDSCINGRIS